MASAIEKVKHVLHMDKDKSTTHTHDTTGTSGISSTTHNTTGTSGLSSNHSNGQSTLGHNNGVAGSNGLTGSNGITGHNGVAGHNGVSGHNGSTNAGPHNSNLANKLDPRVDSDLSKTTGTYGSHGAVGHGVNVPTGVAGQPLTQNGQPVTGNHHSHTTTGGLNSNTTSGPHASNVANVVDPRVDSDRSHTHGGLTGNHSHTTAVGGLNGNNYSGQTATGAPHTSNLANKLDPTVKTTSGIAGQYDGTHLGNSTGQNHTGTVGGISNSSNAGPHNSNLLNKADPLVDSDLGGRGNKHGVASGGIPSQSGSYATPGSGNAQNTAGPHNSDALNKLDPRVDADLDGSKTFGGNKTYQ